jgi:CheY-like chemotaxis protein
MSKFNQYRTFEMTALVFCRDDAFLVTMNRVLRNLGLQTYATADVDSALSLIKDKKLDAIVLDWDEVANLAGLFEQIKGSRMNQDAVQVVIAHNLMDIRQAFSSGVQFLIHKPASGTQISGCLEAMRGAVLNHRRLGHRESVRISADLTVNGSQLLGAMIVNISNDGLGLMLDHRTCKASAELSAGSDIQFAFVLPETQQLIIGSGLVKWINRDGNAGVEFINVAQRRESNAGLQFQCMLDSHKEGIDLWVAERFDRQVARLRIRHEEDSLKKARA